MDFADFLLDKISPSFKIVPSLFTQDEHAGK